MVNAGVAPTVEQLSEDQRDGGSNPSTSTTLTREQIYQHDWHQWTSSITVQYGNLKVLNESSTLS